MTLNELVKLTTLWTTGPWNYFSHQYVKHLIRHFFSAFNVDIFLLSPWKNGVGIIRIASLRHVYNEYTQQMFSRRWKKYNYLITLLFGAMWIPLLSWVVLHIVCKSAMKVQIFFCSTLNVLKFLTHYSILFFLFQICLMQLFLKIFIGIANSGDPDQTLIWVCTVCICCFSDHFGVWNIRTFTIFTFNFSLSMMLP